MALAGRAAEAYDIATIATAHKLASPDNSAITAFHYPPLFLLITAPLACLPYLAAYVVFSLGSLTLWLMVAWYIRPRISTLVLSLLFPGTWICLLAGQNSLLTASLVGLTVLGLQQGRMRLASTCSILLAYKPQIGILAALVTACSLLAQRRYIAILTAIISASSIFLLSVFFFGLQSWTAFIDNMPKAMHLLEQGDIPLNTMISPFAAVRYAGATIDLAYLTQTISATLACSILLIVWRKHANLNLRLASLCATLLLVTPHLFQYELPIMGLALVAMCQFAENRGWRFGEAPFLIACFMAHPLLAATPVGLGYFPLVSIAFALYILYCSICSPPHKCAKAQP